MTIQEQVRGVLDVLQAKLIRVLRLEKDVEIAIKKAKEFEDQALPQIHELYVKEIMGYCKLLLEADSMLSYIRHRCEVSKMGQLTYAEIDSLIGRLRRRYESLAEIKAKLGKK